LRIPGFSLASNEASVLDHFCTYFILVYYVELFDYFLETRRVVLVSLFWIEIA
jgi:hypothetical protein